MDDLQKFHFHMACAEITFVDGEANTGITRVNSMVKSQDGRVGVRLLARAQQAAQIQLQKSLQDPGLNTLNVVFLSMSYLGEFTDEEFTLTEEQAQEGALVDQVAGNA